MIGVNVAQLLMLPQGTERRCSFDEEASALGEAGVVAPVRGQASLVRTGPGILANCQFETALAGECARCLEATTTPVSGRFQEEFVPTVDVRTGVPLPDEVESEAFPIGEDHVLNLGEAIRQHVLMAAPLQPLCRPDCRGLCPECGHNLNEGACGCAPVTAGSPFNALRQLLENTEDRVRGA
jgi:uncharacterized protein